MPHRRCCGTRGRGNVRELKNAIERSVYRAPDATRKIARIAFDPFDSPYNLSDREPKTTAPTPTSQRTAPLLPTNFKEEMRNAERALLQAALEKARFNQRVAADLLGLSYDQIRGKIKKHRFDRR